MTQPVQPPSGIAAIAAQAFLVLASSGCLYLLYTIVYNAYFHPLAAFKGPFIAKVSHYYTVLWELRANRAVGVDELLQTYGSPVRIAPNELAFSDEKAFNDLYAQQADPFPKGAMYSLLTANGSINILNASTKKEHAPLRRLFAHSFSAKGLRSSEAAISARVKSFVDMTFGVGRRPDEPVDVYTKLCNHFLDIISLLAFGESLDCLHGKNPDTLRGIQGFNLAVPATSMVPALRYLPFASIQNALRSIAELEATTRKRLSAFIARCKMDGTSANDQSFLYNFVTAEDPETGLKLSMDELVDNVMIFLVAGTDTTANTVTYVLWECGRRAEVRRRLVDEIREAFPDPDVMPTFEKASSLPYLRCVIDETLRLWGPLNTARQQRISLGRKIGDHYVPAGAIALSSIYSMARDPVAFPEPEQFVPERWQNASSRMRNMCRPFSIGQRNCIGKHLAEMNYFLTIARIYQLFDVDVVGQSMTEDMMKVRDQGILGPRDHKLVVRAEARSANESSLREAHSGQESHS